MDICAECGYLYDPTTAERAASQIRQVVTELAGLLKGHHPDPRRRRQADVWSPLEYACHVRDVLLVQRERVLAARRANRPPVDPMGVDERVEHDGYAEQEPGDVARQLEDAALLFANVLARLGSTEWEDALLQLPVPRRALHTLGDRSHPSRGAPPLPRRRATAAKASGRLAVCYLIAWV